MNNIYDLLTLLSVQGVGSYRIRSLVGHFGSPKTILQAKPKDLIQVDGIDEKIAYCISSKVDKKFADEQLNKIQKYKVQIVSYWDSEYPKLLKKIYDPPVLIYVKGRIEDDDQNRIAIVGTRSPTNYGNTIACRISDDLAKNGITIVSGMARGIDTQAHWGAIKGGGKTIAVLGSGLDVIYPSENLNLSAEIAESGALISEFSMGTEPTGGHFPRRNRIISGLSLGTVVVEAGERSGALITAFMALDQGREVFAVPGDIRSNNSKGTHRLIKEGARLIEGTEDIFSEIPQWNNKKEKKENLDSIISRLNKTERMMWDVLSDEPRHIDQISTEINVTTSEALVLLLSMELKNCVKQLSGMMFVRSLS
jgi:DNA processing protein